jgi:hypothetical protein
VAVSEERFTLDAMRENARRTPPPRYAGAVSEMGHKERRDRIDLFMAQRPQAAEQPIAIFHHIRKTAGSAMRGVLAKNLTGARALFHYAPKVDTNEEPYAEWYRQFYASLRRKERYSLLCVAGHSLFGVRRGASQSRTL